MNPLDTLKALPWILVVALALLLGLMTRLYLGERDALATSRANFSAFVAGVKLEGEQAEAANARKDAEHKQNLETIKEEYESQIPRIRHEAVDNYLSGRASAVVRQRSAANPGSGAMPGNGAGIKLDDGEKRQCVFDEAFIQDAAEDAAKLDAWQQYCTLNHCPVKD